MGRRAMWGNMHAPHTDPCTYWQNYRYPLPIHDQSSTTLSHNHHDTPQHLTTRTMASDDLVWSVIGTDFCSFKLKTSKEQVFCRNENNVSGFCSRQSCPLANSRYATLRHDASTGSIYLYIKAIERAHLPSKW